MTSPSKLRGSTVFAGLLLHKSTFSSCFCISNLPEINCRYYVTQIQVIIVPGSTFYDVKFLKIRLRLHRKDSRICPQSPYWYIPRLQLFPKSDYYTQVFRFQVTGLTKPDLYSHSVNAFTCISASVVIVTTNTSMFFLKRKCMLLNLLYDVLPALKYMKSFLNVQTEIQTRF